MARHVQYGLGFTVKGPWPKTCKVVNHPTKPYVRDYKREVAGGKSRMEAEWEAAYRQFPLRFSNLWDG